MGPDQYPTYNLHAMLVYTVLGKKKTERLQKCAIGLQKLPSSCEVR